MQFNVHVFWHYMFWGPILDGVKITILLAIASQAAGIVLGTFAALGRLSTLRLGRRFVCIGAIFGFLSWKTHDALQGEFNAWWSRHLGANPPGGVEAWLMYLLAGIGILWVSAGILGVLWTGSPAWIHRISRPEWYPFRSIVAFYLWLFRGTPLLVQIAFVYFAIPEMTGYGLLIDAIPSAFIALALNEGAYMAEIVRAGISSVDAGQTEAALSVGMTRGLAMRRIVLPQAVRIIIPPTGNEFISMIKNTSLAYSIAVSELWYQSTLVFTSGTGFGSGHYFELITVASVWYLILTTVFSFLQVFVERRFERGFDRDAGESVGDQFLRDLGRNLIPRRIWLPQDYAQ